MTREPPERGYRDLHEHLAALDAAGLLVTIDRPICKDTEMNPLVRWQFRGGIREPDRKAFLFIHVTDAKGKHYDIPGATWTRAIANPVAPRVVENAPCQEIVVTGDALDVPGQGIASLPIPISTPGWDNAPYTTLSQQITKDPDSGIQNMGIYRGQVKAPRRLGMNPTSCMSPAAWRVARSTW